MRQLDVHDDQVGDEGAGAGDRFASVAHGLYDKFMRTEQIAEKFEVQFVVLDNEHPFCHARMFLFLSGR